MTVGDGAFAGTVALVTGAASGIGEATATAFRAAGARVAVVDVNDAAGGAVAERLGSADGGAHFVRADVTNADDVRAMVARTVEVLGGLDVAVNVAGGMAGGDRPGMILHETDESAWDGTMSLNLRGTWLCLREEIMHMLTAGGGAICNVASVAGLVATKDSSVSYAVAKAGVVHLTRIAAVTYADRGIRVNAVAPGLTATPAVRASLSPEQQIPRAHLIKRMVLPEEQAQAILWLCSPAAAMTTGHVLPVDGGWTAR